MVNVIKPPCSSTTHNLLVTRNVWLAPQYIKHLLVLTLCWSNYEKECIRTLQYHLHPVDHWLALIRLPKNHCNATHLLLMVWYDETTFLKTILVSLTHYLSWMWCDYIVFIKYFDPAHPLLVMEYDANNWAARNKASTPTHFLLVMKDWIWSDCLA